MNPPICVECGRAFQPDPRTADFQKVCGRPACRRARLRAKLRRWRALHPDCAIKGQAKVRAWAKAYPDYWQVYRKDHPTYVKADNERRRRAHESVKCAANVTAIDSIARRKQETLAVLSGLKSAANVTAMDRRINGVVDYLISRDAAANVTPIAPTGDGSG
jgi:hypothetical protein